MARKRRKKSGPSKSTFKLTGGHDKIKVDDKKEKTYYFRDKVSIEEAREIASRDGADIFGTSESDLKVSKPRMKYEFYCIYDADLEMKYLRKRKQEIGVNEQVKYALVGDEIVKPRKGREIPGRALKLEIVELVEIERSDSMILDGRTGGPANALEDLLTGPGKKRASSTWIKKAKVASGRWNSVAKVVRGVKKAAKKRPSDAKRVIEHNLTFKKLLGLYVPTYYVKVSLGEDKKTLRVNGITGDVALDV